MADSSEASGNPDFNGKWTVYKSEMFEEFLATQGKYISVFFAYELGWLEVLTVAAWQSHSKHKH